MKLSDELKSILVLAWRDVFLDKFLMGSFVGGLAVAIGYKLELFEWYGVFLWIPIWLCASIIFRTFKKKEVGR